jgi:hypothetical protein
MDVDRFKYPVPCESLKWKEQCSWVLARFGPIGSRWDYHKASFYFTNEKDQMLFQIAWG